MTFLTCAVLATVVLLSPVAAVGTADGSAFVSGTTDVVYLRAQGTGTYTADGSDAHGVTGAVTTIEAIFTPAK